MGDEDDKVPNGDDPQATTPAEAPSTEEALDDLEEKPWGWDAEIPEGDDEETPADEPEPEADATETDNSQPPSDTPADPRGAPPAGFRSWDEVIAAASANRAPPPPEKPVAPRRGSFLPHDDDPLVVAAVGELADLDPQQRAERMRTLPAGVQEKAAQRFNSLAKVHRELRDNPLALIQRVTDEVTRNVLDNSQFAERILALENQFYQRTGQEFLVQNKISSEEQADLLGLMRDGLARDKAVKIVQERRELRKLRAGQQGVETSRRQIEANQATSRAQQGAKGKGRTPGDGLKAAFKAAGTDVKKLAKLAEKQERAKGR